MDVQKGKAAAASVIDKTVMTCAAFSNIPSLSINLEKDTNARSNGSTRKNIL
jgi:hypothetical protein